jgi:hypothetical protein
MNARSSVLREGVLAGIVGAAIVALWFLVLDVGRGQPLLTPGLLGTAVFRGGADPATVQIALGPVLGYTLIHVAAFVGFGIVAASLLATSEREPAMFVAFVVLFAAFEVSFFLVLERLGPSLLGALVWWRILGANLLAAVGMLWFFLRAHPGAAAPLVGASGPVLREGVVAGLIGAAVVMAWFLVLDAVAGEPLTTPRILARALLGQADPLGGVLSYTLVHVGAFVVLGIVGALLVAGAERDPMFLFLLVVLYLGFEVLFFAVVLVLARWVFDHLAGWAVAVANLCAAAAMLAYYLTRHRELARRLSRAVAGAD